MADKWIELDDGTIVNLNNIVRLHILEGEWVLYDTSGYLTNISPLDKKRIINLLSQNSCLELLDRN